MTRIPDPKEENVPSLWLVLDEVVDPQNFGALLRSAHFLGGGSPTEGNIGSTIGIMVRLALGNNFSCKIAFVTSSHEKNFV